MHKNVLKNKVEAVIWLISSNKSGLDVSSSFFGRGEHCIKSQKHSWGGTQE